MIQKSNHPWANFLYARKLVIDWMLSEEFDGENGVPLTYDSVARKLSMDRLQVQLIHLTPVQK